MNPQALVQFMVRGETPAGQQVARAIAAGLEVRYPGHCWRIDVRCSQRVVHLNHMLLSGRYGMVVPIQRQTCADLAAEVIRAGGELLERYGLARGALDDDKWAALPRDYRLEPVADHG